jgi:hypothetical protein
MKSKRGTNRATQFSRDLINALDKHRTLQTRLGISIWKKNWHVPIGGHESVDVAGLADGGDAVILIEAELRRQATSLNVLKIWQWAADRTAKRHQVFFVQAFTRPYYKELRGHRIKCEFLAEKMMEEFPRIHYKQVRIHYTPGKSARKGGGRRTHHAKNLALSVVRVCKAFTKA